MGGSLAKAIKHFSPCTITGVDSSEAVIQAAFDFGCIDSSSTVAALPSSVELVFVCTPMSRIKDHIQQLLHSTSSDTLISDIGSAKAYLAKENFPNRVILGHPIAGKAGGGFSASDALLFKERSYILVPPKKAPDGYDALKVLLGSLGAILVECDAYFHDQQLALSSHFPYFAAKAAYDMTQTHGLKPPFIGPGYESFTRLAHSQEAWAKDISLFNKESLVEALQLYQDQLSKLLKKLHDNH